MKYIIFSEGNYVVAENSYEYSLKDHLGNVRITFTENGVLQRNDYYPFGLQIPEHSVSNYSGTYENEFLYNGKELQNDLGLGWHDYGARFYDAALGRFFSLDPKAGEFTFQSPCVYANNSPIRYIDFMGMNSTEQWKKDNGITDDDLITIYEAPDRDDNDPDGGDDNDSKKENSSSMNTATIASLTTITSLTGLKAEDLFKIQNKYSDMSGYVFDASPAKVETTIVKTAFGSIEIPTKYLKYLGKGVLIFNFTYTGNEIRKTIQDENKTTFSKATNSGSAMYSLLGGYAGAAWGFGWEIGRSITETSTYQYFKKDLLRRVFNKTYFIPIEYQESILKDKINELD